MRRIITGDLLIFDCRLEIENWDEGKGLPFSKAANACRDRHRQALFAFLQDLPYQLLAADAPDRQQGD
jgi:hypothetical protein